MIQLPVRTRIAPTPSGFLHLGNLYSFVLTWLEAKSHGGTVLLRIDDLDAERMRPEFLEDIFRVLECIGMVPDEGPSGPEDFTRNHSQSTRMDFYRSILNELLLSGHVYACSCSRKEVLAHNDEGTYTGYCRDRKLEYTNNEFAWRLALPAGTMVAFYDYFRKQKVKIDLNKEMGDFVVRRKGGIPAYQVASYADDLFFDINLIIRGEDLTVSTAAQLKLAEVLGQTTFSATKWLHHPLITNKNDEKLSKSAGDTSIKWMMHQGATGSEILGRIGSRIFGKEITVTSLPEMLEMYPAIANEEGS